jgi:hypothetical protein
MSVSVEKDFSSRLVFVGCSPRSGSTLLTRIFNSHSRIAAPCEIGIPRYFEGDAEKYALVCEKYKQICDFYQSDYQQCYQDPSILLARILDREGKEGLIIKDPRQSLFLKTITGDFPEAKFIFLVRDVRAVAMSVMFRNQPQMGFRRWYEYNQAVLRALQMVNPLQTRLIRYEDLVSHPEQSIGRLVEFLGYQFEPGMLNYGDSVHTDDKLLLWNGSPAESPLQSALQHGSINKKMLRNASEISESVMDLYRRVAEVRELNNMLGYS